MLESCGLNADLSRKNQTAILQRLASVGQKPVADALGVSEATVSRMKSDGVESFTGLLAVLGLKVVPAEHKCYAADYIASLRFFAKRGMEQDEDAPKLEWGVE